MALTDNLAAWWTLNETSGTRNDSHSSNHLTDHNSTSYAAGKKGNAADFESSSSQYLSIADNASLSMADIDFTVACWVNMESTPANTLILGKAGASDAEFILEYAGLADRFKWTVCGATGFASCTSITTASPPSTGTWYFLVAWHNAATNEIGLCVNDGTPVTASHTAGCYNSGAPFLVGGFPDYSNYFDGLVDEAAVWKRVLTSGEITTLYNAGAGTTYSDFAGGGSTASPHYYNMQQAIMMRA